MTEIIWCGRGGQGAFTAAKLLGAAYALRNENSFSLAFPSFGPERRGAPVRAFSKLNDAPIGNRSEIEKADYIVYLDETLFSDNAFSKLKPDGKILLNTKHRFDDDRIVTIDGTALALEILKLPITNTIMLGAFTVMYGGISLVDTEEAIRRYMPSKLHEVNITAVRQAAAAVRKEAIG